MGFDIYGVSPTIKEGSVKPKIDWKKKPTKAESDKYFKEKNIYETENPGAYFRNNVWWWRPLWNYVCEICDDVMTRKNREAGYDNSGYIINKCTADEMVSLLKAEIALGNHRKYEEEYKENLDSLPLLECRYCKGTGTRTWKEEGKDIEQDCNVCNTEYTKEQGIPVGKEKQWECSYPFDAENVENFVKFLECSGGIEIC
jgi:hypothetical protein